MRRPSFLVVVFDQLRHDVVADAALCETPTFDRLRGSSTWFDRHYTPNGVCSPARASFMTGRYPHVHGVITNIHSGTAVVRDLSESHPTIGELLTEAGYRTGYVGKWHLGMTRGAANRGFTDVRFPEGEDDPTVAPALEDYVGSMVYTRPRGDHGQRFPIYMKEPVPPSLIPANVAFRETLELLDAYAHHREPFCIVVSFPEPHHPTILPPEHVDRYDPATIDPWPSFSDTFEDKPRAHASNLEHYGVASFTWEDWAPIVARYLATVTMLDQLLGDLLGELERLRRADDTVVVVTADHGDMTGSHRQFNKGPMMYEDVYRIPLVVRAPEGGGAGRHVDALTSHVDLFPTIADLAGVDLPRWPAPGRSLTAWLDDDEPPEWRRSLMCEFHGDEFGLYSQRMLVRDGHKLVYNPNDVDELYDLREDPFELRNLAFRSDHAELRLELERELLTEMRATGDGLAEFAGMMLG